MKPGEVMNALITSVVRKMDKDIEHNEWSTKASAALELREFVSATGIIVCNVKQTGAPLPIEEYCSMADIDEDNRTVSYASSQFAESLTRTFLLYHYGFYGEHLNAEYEEEIRKARPNPTAKILSFTREVT
jgi:hypothetical protein